MAPMSAKPRTPSKSASSPITLAIDIGGSHLKMMLLDPAGKPVSDRLRVETPETPTPKAVLAALRTLAKPLPHFDRISAGFPGVVKKGVTWLSVNLHPDWIGFPLQDQLTRLWKRPARVTNDAAVQGYGAIRGHGVELTLTVGTGLGSALFTDGRLCPGLELGHHPWRKHTYEDYLGRRGLDKYGEKKWNQRLQEAIEQTRKLFNWDHLYIGGGNTKKIDFTLPEHTTIVPNETGLLGGVALWREWK